MRPPRHSHPARASWALASRARAQASSQAGPPSPRALATAHSSSDGCPRRHLRCQPGQLVLIWQGQAAAGHRQRPPRSSKNLLGSIACFCARGAISSQITVMQQLLSQLYSDRTLAAADRHHRPSPLPLPLLPPPPPPPPMLWPSRPLETHERILHLLSHPDLHCVLLQPGPPPAPAPAPASTPALPPQPFRRCLRWPGGQRARAHSRGLQSRRCSSQPSGSN